MQSAVLLWQVTCLSVTLRYHIGWITSKIISQLAWVFALCKPQHDGSTPKGILARIGVGYGKVAFGIQQL